MVGGVGGAEDQVGLEVVEHEQDGLVLQRADEATKLELIDRLADAGLRDIEVASFVSPKCVPQMADHAEIMQGLKRRPGVNYRC